VVIFLSGKGFSPVPISYSITPSEKISLRPSTGAPLYLFGRHVRACPVREWLLHGAIANLAVPKSVTLPFRPSEHQVYGLMLDARRDARAELQRAVKF